MTKAKMITELVNLPHEYPRYTHKELKRKSKAEVESIYEDYKQAVENYNDYQNDIPVW